MQKKNYHGKTATGFVNKAKTIIRIRFNKSCPLCGCDLREHGFSPHLRYSCLNEKCRYGKEHELRLFKDESVSV